MISVFRPSVRPWHQWRGSSPRQKGPADIGADLFSTAPPTLLIIKKKEEPTDRVNKLNGKIRLCLDPQTLKTTLQRKYYQIPTIERFSIKMAGVARQNDSPARQTIESDWRPPETL
ncbi:leucine-rich repeat-containing protein 74a-like [Plakobranchus ocellatus]|uniref:Leucine-rich repeat-containing protein 74a-like n=1 Tax=Plakobranchus ocellatus TaxID=259542 RepID=A0AAV4CF75_9GAST|nr:leucine-rich repeat-containing protein 74a-like [Plakobranchus ocellatus]